MGQRRAVVDSQSLRGADTVGSDSRGYDAGKKLNGRKRHIVTDTLGLLLVVMVIAVANRMGSAASPCCPAAGWWSEPSPG